MCTLLCIRINFSIGGDNSKKLGNSTFHSFFHSLTCLVFMQPTLFSLSRSLTKRHKGVQAKMAAVVALAGHNSRK
jgi:hypothetical protein